MSRGKIIVLITLGIVAILVAAVIALSVRTEEEYEENSRLQRQQQHANGPTNRMGGGRAGAESGRGEAAEAEQTVNRAGTEHRGSPGDNDKDKDENGRLSKLVELLKLIFL